MFELYFQLISFIINKPNFCIDQLQQHNYTQLLQLYSTLKMIRNTLQPLKNILKYRHNDKFKDSQEFQDSIQIRGKKAYSTPNFNNKFGIPVKFAFSFFKQDVTIDYQKNYYQILKVKETATLIQIKKSFYTMAKQSHPDTSKGDQQLFKLINQAYNVLSHQDRRKQYDINRCKNQDNPNDARGVKDTRGPFSQNQDDKNYQQRDQTAYEDYKQSQEYSDRKDEAYYHHSRGQWQQFRSGYKYHVNPERQYYANISNNISTGKTYQNLKRKYEKKSQKQEQFLEQMQKYFEYLNKLNQKKKKDMENYHIQMEKMEKQNAQNRKQAFKRTLFGRTILKTSNFFSNISDRIQNYLAKQKKNQNQQK